MKRLATTAVLAAVLVLGVALPAQAATFQGKRVMYYADHTDAGRYDWRVDQSVALWNRNPNVVLQEVADCAGFVPCVTLVETFRAPEGYGSMVGSYWETLDPSANVIELYAESAPRKSNGWYDMPAAQRWRYFQSLSCHELGHYIVGDHTPTGCLSEDGRSVRPGASLSLVPA